MEVARTFYTTHNTKMSRLVRLRELDKILIAKWKVPELILQVHKPTDVSRTLLMNVGAVRSLGCQRGDTAEISHASGSNFPRSQPLNGLRSGRTWTAVLSSLTPRPEVLL